MDASYVNLMAGDDVFLIAKQIVGQSWDKYKVGRKLGGQDDLAQAVAEILLSVKDGKIVFDPARKSNTGDTNVSFACFVMGKARGLGLTNWMREAPRKRPEPADVGEEGDDEKVEFARTETITPSRGGADAQADPDVDVDYDDGAAPVFDDIGEEYDDRLTPAHRLLRHSDTSALADLLDCTNRTICNLLARANDRQELSEKAARLKNKVQKVR